MKVVRQISYTIQFRSSLLKMWKATLQACIRPAAFLSAVLTAIFTPIVASLLLFHWNIVVLFVLMFVSITSAFALIFSLELPDYFGTGFNGEITREHQRLELL